TGLQWSRLRASSSLVSTSFALCAPPTPLFTLTPARMADSFSLLEGDLSCPVCCEIFREPVILSCSHSLCRACLEETWSKGGTQDCPVCRRRSSRDQPPPNLESLQLFCLEDECLVCVECVLEHADHSFCSVGKAAGQRRKGLRPQLEALQKKMAAFSKAELTCDKMVAHIRVQTQRAERQIKEEFEKLHCFLRDEEVERLGALKEEEEEKNKRMKERVDEISEIMSSLSDTIRAVEEKLAVDDDVSFLQSYKTIMERTQSVPEDPQLGSRALINLAKHLGNLSFQVWEKMQKAVKYTPVVLDPNTAHPSLCLSEDLTSLRPEDKLQSLPDNPERFDFYRDILGSEGFTSGTHFWDVEVGESDDWSVGVASESVSRKIDKKSGLWAVGVRDGEPYNMMKKTQRIRVSWDKWEVSFFRLSPHIRKLKTIQHKCTERMYPHFHLHNGQTLQILPGKVSLKVENHSV
uniref:Uncharacterized protein n=1 Tax=Oncorhynchus kisutch TaxID=8019 RepID=A0A8C7D3D0_ONCKI